MTSDEQYIRDERLSILSDGSNREPTPSELGLAQADVDAFRAQMSAPTVTCRKCGALICLPAETVMLESARTHGVASCDQCTDFTPKPATGHTRGQSTPFKTQTARAYRSPVKDE